MTKETSLKVSFEYLLDPPPQAKALMTINAYMTCRWLPLEANREFKKASAEIDQALRGMIRSRMKEMGISPDSGVSRKRRETGGENDRMDLLTYMLGESYASGSPWSEYYIMGHVSRHLAHHTP